MKGNEIKTKNPVPSGESEGKMITVNKKSAIPYTPNKYKITFFYWETTEEMAKESVVWALKKSLGKAIKDNVDIEVEEVEA